jgi:hypothetical protein
VDPAPIGPNQFFTGLVNGTNVDAVVTTDRIGPIVPGELGHPVSGQFVSVDPAGVSGSAADLGFAGSLGNSVRVFGSSPARSHVPLRATGRRTSSAIRPAGAARPSAWVR